MTRLVVGASIAMSLAFGFIGRAHAQVTTRVLNTVANGTTSARPSISADGRYVAYQIGGGFERIFVFDRNTGTSAEASVDSSGTQAENASANPSISADGRYVAFESRAQNLVAGDVPNTYDIFVRDRVGGTTTLASVAIGGGFPNGQSHAPSISADGRYVAFYSTASDLVALDTNGRNDVFVRDRVAGTTVLASINLLGNSGNNESLNPSISANGAFVAFTSLATNLVAGASNGFQHVFARDLAAGMTEKVSVAAGGTESDGTNSAPSISGDGRYVAFSSSATNLDPNDVGPYIDIYVRDRTGDTTTRITVDAGGTQANQQSDAAAISADGRYVAFESFATNFVANDTNGELDVFEYDRQGGLFRTLRASVSTDGVEGNNQSRGAAVSGDGRFVAYASLASNLISNDPNAGWDVFVRDRATCKDGTVNSGAGPVADVLTINGATGTVTVPTHTAFHISLVAAPQGPASGRYGMWIWIGGPVFQTDLRAMNQTLGCTVNPTPLQPSLRPQPFKCLSGGLPAAVCGAGGSIGGAPARAPWTLPRNSGLANPITFTVQGVLQDSGAGNPTGYSVTNAVVLRIQ